MRHETMNNSTSAATVNPQSNNKSWSNQNNSSAVSQPGTSRRHNSGTVTSGSKKGSKAKSGDKKMKSNGKKQRDSNKTAKSGTHNKMSHTGKKQKSTGD